MAIGPEEVAFRLVELYIKNIASKGEKKQMGLDTIINAYFYTVSRLQRKSGEMQFLNQAVAQEKKAGKREKAEELLSEWDEELR